MNIKKVVLENIRSYVKEEIEFPSGSLLLSGDIGSGKSSILLAVEFALFGLMRGYLSGGSLLRNGEDKGSVKLFFEVEGKPVEICRTLKRTSSSVAQDAGYIVINGEKKEGTAVELKQAVIELLNYPQDLLTKSKSFIYRYTVYTPQEEMKHILLCNKDDRLETLRRVFGIDKYKKVAANAKIVVSRIKERKKELKGRINDLDEKLQLKLQKENETEDARLDLERLSQPLELAEKEVNEVKDRLGFLEERIAKSRKVKEELNSLDVNLKNTINRKSEIVTEIKSLEDGIEKLRQERLDVNVEETSRKLEEKKALLNKEEENLMSIRNKIQEHKTIKQASETVKMKINDLSNCPTCYQEVSPEYKARVVESESSKIRDIENQMQDNINKEKELGENICIIKNDIETLNKEQHNVELIKHKLQLLKEKENELSARKEEESRLKRNIGEINLKRNELFSKLESMENIEELHATAKRELEESLQKLKEIEMRKVAVETKIKALQDNINQLTKEIIKKQEDKNKLAYATQLQHWLDEHFINLMLTMEKNIMLKVHSDFSTLFEKWFSILIDNAVINVQLDDSFSPAIEQNGYETDYEFLSGGEKTAAALAYRLSLNQVINNLMSTIKTRDLIILDEPTDGFSNEQLDKLRLLFNELDVSQLVIVSHEPKVESFVDHVIRFNKNEHISQVA